MNIEYQLWVFELSEQVVANSHIVELLEGLGDFDWLVAFDKTTPLTASPLIGS